MSVNSLKSQSDELQAMYTAFKTGYQSHLDTTTDYENRFMNAFEDFSSFITKGMQDLTSIIDKHIQLVSKIQADHEKNKFEEGNFNKVSLIKKQDTTIRQLEIKVAELESKLLAKTSNPVNPTQPEPTVCTSVPMVHQQCFARIGKAKYNIKKQDPAFMDDFPIGTYVTKTGCVVGLACSNIITEGQVFCQDHSNGKFEDIRMEPGSSTVSAIITTVDIVDTAGQDPAPEKKGKGRKQPAKTQDAEPAPVPAVILTPAEPVPVPAVILTPAEPVPVPAVILTPAEPVPVPAVILTPTEPFIINEPDIELSDEETETLNIQQQVVEEEIHPELVSEQVIKPLETIHQDNIPLPNFDDIEFYDDPSNNKTYYLDSKTRRVFEIAPNDEIGVFVKFI